MCNPAQALDYAKATTVLHYAMKVTMRGRRFFCVSKWLVNDVYSTKVRLQSMIDKAGVDIVDNRVIVCKRAPVVEA